MIEAVDNMRIGNDSKIEVPTSFFGRDFTRPKRARECGTEGARRKNTELPSRVMDILSNLHRLWEEYYSPDLTSRDTVMQNPVI